MAWPTLNLDTLEKPRRHSAPVVPPLRTRPNNPPDQPDQARLASERLNRLVGSLTAKVGKNKNARTRVAPKARYRQDKTISYEAYLRRKQLCLRAVSGLAVAGLCAVLLSGLVASSDWGAENRAKRIAEARYETGILSRQITEMDQQVAALDRRAAVQANYLSELRADPTVHELAADEAKAAAINADLDRLTREESKLRGQLHALGKEIVALQVP